MIKLILNPKIIAAAVFVALAFGVVATHSQEVFAQSTDQACRAIGGCDDGEDDIQGVLETTVNIVSVAVGIAAVIMIIYGGFKYITSGGDSGKISSAKNTLIYAIIGLVIVALAQFIVVFVLANVD